MPATAASFTLLAMQLSLRHRRALAAIFASGIAAGGLAVPSATATHPPPVPTLHWADCGDGFECATADVPLDYRKPRRDAIDLSLVRHPALDQANRIGTLVLAAAEEEQLLQLMDAEEIPIATYDRPVYIAQGTAEPVVYPPASATTAELLTAAGTDVTFRFYPGADHNGTLQAALPDQLAFAAGRFS